MILPANGAVATKSPTKPIIPATPSRSTLAWALVRYPSSLAAAWTRRRVSSENLVPAASLSTKETVAWETPAAAATSFIVVPERLPGRVMGWPVYWELRGACHRIRTTGWA
ncbi:hypothetical protein AHiyo1_21650 [Arthrobacter sp. Hiyo1]|nr:hypothetical protein AHiyo1_21650 [Arthrobacter sp. Hiyo1]